MENNIIGFDDPNFEERLNDFLRNHPNLVKHCESFDEYLKSKERENKIIKDDELVVDDRELEGETDEPLKRLSEEEQKDLDDFIKNWKENIDNAIL